MLEWFSQHIGGPAILIFIGALVAATGALWASVEQTKSEKYLKEKNLEIADLNKQISMSITGGDSFSYIGLPLNGSQGDKLLPAIVQQGQYPLYDVNVRIVDLEKSDSLQKKGLSFIEAMNKTQTIINVGNIPAGSAQMIGSIDLTGQTHLRYNVFTGARNGFVTQLIRFQKVNGIWKGAMKVERDGQKLLEKIDPNYPLNGQGEIDWN